MTHAVPPSSASPRVQRPWQDWLLSLLLHLVVLAALWWLTQSKPTPQRIAIETPIEWAGGGGGGGGGGQGDGQLGGGGGGGDGTALLEADGDKAPEASPPDTSDTPPQQTSPHAEQEAPAPPAPAQPDEATYAAARRPQAAAKKEARAQAPRKPASAPDTETIVANHKREVAARLAAQYGRTKKTGIDAAQTGGIGTGTGTGIGSGSGTGIGSGEGSGIGASKGSGTGGGSGSGLGSGTGPGIGSGSGGGVGSGEGTGTGSGRGSGVGTGEGSGVGSGVGAGVGSGFGDGTGKEKANWQQILRSYIQSRKRYPGMARRLGQQGTVRVQASFAADGRLLSASVAGSAGVAALDEAALQLVADAASAAAQKAQPGQAVQLRIPIQYELRD